MAILLTTENPGEPVTKPSQWSHQTDIAPDAGGAAQARLFVLQHLSAHGVPTLVDDVRLAASELVTNALRHACPPLTMMLRGYDETVRLELLDGRPTQPVLVTAATSDTHGRGVAIVEALSRRWGVTDLGSDGKSVWAEFDA